MLPTRYYARFCYLPKQARCADTLRQGLLYSIWLAYRRVAIVTLCKSTYTYRRPFCDNGRMNLTITLPDLEQAINYWRHQKPSRGEESRLCAEAAALATPYALMIMHHQREIPTAHLTPTALAAYQAWRATLSP